MVSLWSKIKGLFNKKEVTYSKPSKEDINLLLDQDNEQRESKRKQDYEEREHLANEKLRQQLADEQKRKEDYLKKPKTTPLRSEPVKEKPKNEAPQLRPSILQEAEELSGQYSSLLYIYADVKRIRAIEWIDGKKRVALNKEREIRHTHKGGFSQEKFQHFVDSQKKKAPEWVEDNLTREGVLRPPYEHIILECTTIGLREPVEKMIEQFK